MYSTHAHDEKANVKRPRRSWVLARWLLRKALVASLDGSTLGGLELQFVCPQSNRIKCSINLSVTSI